MEKYTPFGHSDYQTIVADDQEVRGRASDRGGLDHQRRLERAVLQGARQPGPEGRRHPGRRVLGRRGRAARHRHQAAGRPPGRLELLHVDRQPGQQGVHREVEGLRQGKNNLPARRQARDQRPDGGHLHRHPHVGAGGRAGRHAPTSTRCRQAVGGQTFKAPSASTSRWTRRTTTCTSRSSSARSRRRSVPRRLEDRRARSAPSRGARSSPTAAQERRLDLPVGLRQLHRAKFSGDAVLRGRDAPDRRSVRLRLCVPARILRWCARLHRRMAAARLAAHAGAGPGDRPRATATRASRR